MTYIDRLRTQLIEVQRIKADAERLEIALMAKINIQRNIDDMKRKR